LGQDSSRSFKYRKLYSDELGRNHPVARAKHCDRKNQIERNKVRARKKNLYRCSEGEKAGSLAEIEPCSNKGLPETRNVKKERAGVISLNNKGGKNTSGCPKANRKGPRRKKGQEGIGLEHRRADGR